MLSASRPMRAEKIGAWKVNGMENGNPADGTITGTGANAVYLAPANIDRKRTVRISSVINTPEVFYRRGGKIIEVNQIERGVDITLKPYHEYNFKIWLYVLDSTISTFYGGLKEGLPIYKDEANFKLNLRVDKSHVKATFSEPNNGPPGVTPPTKSFQGTDFVWLADPFGQMNITGLSQNDIPLPDDSVLVFSLLHSNATHYGSITKNSADGTIYTSTPPVPYTGSLGIPQIFELDLKRRGPYINGGPILKIMASMVSL